MLFYSPEDSQQQLLSFWYSGESLLLSIFVIEFITIAWWNSLGQPRSVIQLLKIELTISPFSFTQCHTELSGVVSHYEEVVFFVGLYTQSHCNIAIPSSIFALAPCSICKDYFFFLTFFNSMSSKPASAISLALLSFCLVHGRADAGAAFSLFSFNWLHLLTKKSFSLILFYSWCNTVVFWM